MSISTNVKKLFEFFHLVGKLKSTPRTGWVKKGVSGAESIASHMYRMSLMAFLAEESLDKNRAIKMCLVHDLAESIVGDITPTCPVTREKKYAMEKEAMEHIRTLVSEDVAQEIYNLWMEYEEGQSREAIFVKDLDRFDMVFQANEYEEEQPNVQLNEFFQSTKGFFKTPRVRTWVEELTKKRDGRLEEKKVFQ